MDPVLCLKLKRIYKLYLHVIVVFHIGEDFWVTHLSGELFVCFSRCK